MADTITSSDYFVLEYQGRVRKLTRLSPLFTTSVIVVQGGQPQISPAPQEVKFALALEKNRNGQPDKLITDICQGLSNLYLTIFHLGPDLEILAKYDLGNGFVRELIFPEMDLSNKKEVFIEIIYLPEFIKIRPLGNDRVLPLNTYELLKSSFFRLSIDGVDTTSVLKVHPFKIFPAPTNKLSNMKYSSLQFVIDEKTLGRADWQAWLNEFLISRQQQGRKGRLEYLKSINGSALMEVKVKDVMIVSTVFAEPESTVLVGKASIEVRFEQVVIRFP